MRDSLPDSPLLRITIVMMAGIAVGRQIGSLVVSVLPESLIGTQPEHIVGAGFWGVVTLGLLLVGVLVRRWEKIASPVLLLMAFTLGIFLIQNSDEHGGDTTLPLPWVDDVQLWMDSQRAALSQVYADEGLQGDDYGIVAAMTLGEKYRVSDGLRDVYSVSGAAHVFALSGMHLSIIFMILTFILPISRYRKTCTVVQIVILWMYVMLVGYHASVIRAAVMLTIYSLARVIAHRPERSLTVLVFTTALLIVITPQWLFNIGFQMSFVAVLSICLFYPTLFKMAFTEYVWADHLEYSMMQKIWMTVKPWLWGMFALSVTAQMGVAPLVAYYFGRFSTYSLLTNYVVSPATLAVIILALMLLACAAIASVVPWLGFLGTGVAAVLKVVIHLLNGFLGMVIKMPYASIEGIRLNVIQTILVYVIIFCAWRIVVHLYRMYAQRRML